MKGLLVVLVICLAAGSVSADFDELTRTRSLLWSEAALLLEVRRDLEPAIPLTAATRFRAERLIEEALPYLYIEAIQDVRVDSYDRVADRLASSGELYRVLSESASAGASRESAAYARDLHAVIVVYRFPLFGEHGLAAPFIQHERPYPVPRVLGFTPARSFTGLVILAQGEFPSHGKQASERVKPALLPRLYDEDMNPVLFPEMCDPRALAKWGVAAYAYSGGEEALRAQRGRIGDLPLRTMARGVFGRNATDILLSGEVARQLLSREQNRELLRDGKILIIIDAPER